MWWLKESGDTPAQKADSNFSGSDWVNPDGMIFNLRGKSHSGYAFFDVLVEQRAAEKTPAQAVPSENPSGDQTVEYKGSDGVSARADAMEELQKEGLGPESPKTSEKLRSDGWVQVTSATMDMYFIARDKDVIKNALTKNEEALSRVLSRETVYLSFGAGTVEFSTEDIDNAGGDLGAAIDQAATRARASLASLFDMGVWMQNKFAQIRYFRE